jgi:hypothetical protein
MLFGRGKDDILSLRAIEMEPSQARHETLYEGEWCESFCVLWGEAMAFHMRENSFNHQSERNDERRPPLDKPTAFRSDRGAGDRVVPGCPLRSYHP